MNIFIEADSIASEKMSGIGHATLEIIYAIENQIRGTKHKLTIIVPFGKKYYLDKYRFSEIKIRTLPPGYKYVNYLLTRTSFPIPVDIWFGRGVYIFPNYKTWYTPFSKSFMFIHDVAYKIYSDTTHEKNLVYLEVNIPRWIRRATSVITISESSRRDILNFFPEIKNKLSVIYLGVNKEVFYKRSEKEIKNVRNKYDINQKYFLYVGNIEPRKNILKLLDGYKLYCDSITNPAQLVLVGGGGWKEEEINRKIRELKQNGYNIYKPSNYVEDEDLPALYSGSLALVHVSLHEGYGLSLVQAQACGATIIASNLEVFKETLLKDGVIYVPPNDVDQIAKAMRNSSEKKVNDTQGVIKHDWATTAESILILAGIIGGNDE